MNLKSYQAKAHHQVSSCAPPSLRAGTSVQYLSLPKHIFFLTRWRTPCVPKFPKRLVALPLKSNARTSQLWRAGTEYTETSLEELCKCLVHCEHCRQEPSSMCSEGSQSVCTTVGILLKILWYFTFNLKHIFFTSVFPSGDRHSVPSSASPELPTSCQGAL